MSLAAAPASARIAPPRALVTAMIVVPALGAVAAAGLAVWRGGVSPVALWLFGIFYLLSAIGVELGYHRYFSHRAFKCGAGLRTFLAGCGSMAGQGPVLFWAAIHREHHRFADTPLDPHAPLPRGWAGIVRAHVGWLYASRPPDMAKAVPDLIRDPTTMSVQRRYLAWFAAGLIAPTAIGLAFQGPIGALEGLLWGGFVRIFANHQATWSINSLCHLMGARPHETKDQSRNVWLLVIPTLGGAWHNNHHAFPASAVNDLRPWQIDPGAWLIRLAEALGLVWDVKRPRGRQLPRRA